MSDQRIPISQLSETQTAPDASYIAIDDGSLTKKITVENFNSTSTASAQSYAEQAAASAQTVEDNIATSAAQIREATLAAREATQASTSATASATSAYDSASLAQNYSVNAATSAGQAMNAADTVAQGVTESKEYAEDSEAWAVGQRNGSDVPDSDETYQNNAKYYANSASGSATRAEAAAQSITVPDTTLTVSGVAADSKATGDRITELKNDLDASFASVYTGVYTVQDYTLGTANRNGDFIATDNRCRPTEMISISKGDVIDIKNGNMARHARMAWTVDEQGNLTNILDGPWTYTDETVTAEVDCMYLVVFSFDPLSTIDLSTFTGSITVNRVQSFSGLAEEIESIKTKEGEYIDVSNLGWELGTFADTTGLDLDSTNRIRTKDIFLFPKGTVISSTAMNVVLHFWYPSGFNNPQGQMWAQTVTLPQDYYVRIAMKKMDNTTITNIPDVYKDLMIYVPNGGIESKAPIANTDNLMVTGGVNPLFYSTQLMAHRGTSTAPENTLSAYKQAYANGLRMMEADIKFSSDNIPVLLHDDTIDRTSNGSGTCSSIPLETLKTYDFGSWFSPSFAGEKIPTLAEFLVFCKTHNCVAELDLAESNYDEPHLAIIYGVVKQCGMLKNTVFTVYNSAATILKGIDKNIILCIGGIRSQSLAYNAISQNYDCALLILSLPIANFSEQLALYIANLGCKVRTWVVNDAETAVATFESCCDYILTDSLKTSDIVFD